MSSSHAAYDVCVIGGAGHVGAPLSIVMASQGLRVLIYDVNPDTLALLQKGEMPFFEEGAEPLLKRVLQKDLLGFSSNVADIANIPHLIVTIGTPVDAYHNPVLKVVVQCIETLFPYLSDDQTLILRSTVFPGVTDYIAKYLAERGKHPQVAFCPERVVQGFAIKEVQSLPQIVSGTTPGAVQTATALFAKICPKIVEMVPMEAEFAKLFCNVTRYIQFAMANQFYMIVQSAGLDYTRLMEGMKADYPRMASLPSPGFAAGPCLFKDTLQLAGFAGDHFDLGRCAIQINEGLPGFLIQQIRKTHPLESTTFGLLGMAFKANSDDTRASLSYKLKKLLQFQAKAVLTTDPHAKNDPDLLPVSEVIDRSDVLILCVPHAAYSQLDVQNKPLIDIWNFLP